MHAGDRGSKQRRKCQRRDALNTHFLALGEVVVVSDGVRGGAEAKLLSQQQEVSCALDLREAGDLLQLPLVFEDE